MLKSFIISIISIFSSVELAAQEKYAYTVWADVVANVQMPKSSLYFLGTGIRLEQSHRIRNSQKHVFYQLGYTGFLKKRNGAFTANTILLNAGFRHKSKPAFNFSGAIGIQYWDEQIQLNFSDKQIKESFSRLIPSTTLAMGFALKNKYHLNMEFRQLFRIENKNMLLSNHIALSVGHTF